ncbi:hypothetical protein [Variovorax sp. J22R115]|uniref:hypothetical protein n=1 Tax=Variovorax sp. J22R115 TaxID=3053509 RepID=UPI0025760D5B|nr:hypothetical protein [Variovorax sp. J22R115]MDM0052020.1 hypothetical protein [Variovorax sp. J22R115]
MSSPTSTDDAIVRQPRDRDHLRRRITGNAWLAKEYLDEGCWRAPWVCEAWPVVSVHRACARGAKGPPVTSCGACDVYVTPGTIEALKQDFESACELADQARADTGRQRTAWRPVRQSRRSYMQCELALIADALRAGRRLFAAYRARHLLRNVEEAA